MKRSLIAVGIIVMLIGLTLPGYAQADTGDLQIDVISDTDEDTIVLDDMVFKIAADAVFYASDKRSPISFGRFKEGDWVGIIVNADREIVEMWLSSE